MTKFPYFVNTAALIFKGGCDFDSFKISWFREEQALISGNNMKPVVKLLINRHNNKYSYTGASDDNLLKNIELFDKLSLRFSNRVLFIKDVIGKLKELIIFYYGFMSHIIYV